MTTTGQRVLSLAPSATRIISLLDQEHRLVGVTQHCPIDNEQQDIPSVGGWVTPDLDMIKELDPDLIFTTDALQREIRKSLESSGYDIWHAEPTTLNDMIRTVETIGMDLGVAEAGKQLADECCTQFTDIASSVPVTDRPTVYCEEWMDPPMAAGNWVPELVKIAGGEYPLVGAGDRSTEVSMEEISSVDPDYIVFNVCGHGSQVQLDSLEARDWDVTAEFVVVDDTLLNEPSPKLVEGAEYLASVFHGNRPWNRKETIRDPPF